MNLATAKFADIDGVKTRYFEAGNGFPLLLFHGGGVSSSAEDWDRSFDYFAQYFRVYLYDQLGFGFTDKPESDNRIQGRVLHALAFLKKLGIDNAHLVGYSQGTHLIVRIALANPTVVRSLVLSTGRISPASTLNEQAKVSTQASQLSQNPALDLDYIRKLYENLVYKHSELTKEFLERKLAIASAPGNLEAQKARTKIAAEEEKSRYALMEKVPSLKFPALVAWGKEDRVVPFAPVFELFSKLPSADLHVFESCGHCLMLDRTEEYNELVTRFCLAH